MKLLDLTFPSPAENLACDEALLDWCEADDGEEILRFWESPKTFAVVGYANKVAAEVNVAACKAKGIPIFRRCSGGGTVLQGAGCLNYALILQIAENSPLANISSANQFIMEQNRAAIESEFRSQNQKPEFLFADTLIWLLSLATRHSPLFRNFPAIHNAVEKIFCFFTEHSFWISIWHQPANFCECRQNNRIIAPAAIMAIF